MKPHEIKWKQCKIIWQRFKITWEPQKTKWKSHKNENHVKSHENAIKSYENRIRSHEHQITSFEPNEIAAGEKAAENRRKGGKDGKGKKKGKKGKKNKKGKEKTASPQDIKSSEAPDQGKDAQSSPGQTPVPPVPPPPKKVAEGQGEGTDKKAEQGQSQKPNRVLAALSQITPQAAAPKESMPNLKARQEYRPKVIRTVVPALWQEPVGGLESWDSQQKQKEKKSETWKENPEDSEKGNAMETSAAAASSWGSKEEWGSTEDWKKGNYYWKPGGSQKEAEPEA